MDLTSPARVRRLLAQHGLRPKKRLGQHFLIDRNVLTRIVEASGAAPGINILEIGAGLGVVTRELAERGARVVCVEIDPGFGPVLNEVLSDVRGVEVVIADLLKLDLPAFLRERSEGRWVVVGNLPYYVTSPIITSLLAVKTLFSTILVMVQKEVAERFRAAPATANYGSLSVFVQLNSDVDTVMPVSRTVFYPVPEVDSELVKLTVRDCPPVSVSDEDLMLRIVRAAFGKRRKTLLNALSLSAELGWSRQKASAVLAQAGIDPARRGETLSLEEFARLADACAGT